MDLRAIKGGVKEALPPIFIGLGLSFSANGAISAIRSTFDVIEDGHDRSYFLDKDVSPREKLKVISKYYWKTGLSLAAAAGCCALAINGYSGQIATLTATLSYLERDRNERAEKTKEIFGEDAEDKLRAEMAKNHISDHQPPGQLVDLAREKSGYVIWEPITKQWFTMTDTQLNWFERELNRLYSREQTITVNQALKLVPGASITRPDGDIYMWWGDDDYYEFIYYNESFFGRPHMEINLIPIFDKNGNEVYELGFSMEPITRGNWDPSEAKNSQDKQAL